MDRLDRKAVLEVVERRLDTMRKVISSQPNNQIAQHEFNVYVSLLREFRALPVQGEEVRLRAIEQAAHDLLCWTYSHAINVDPKDYTRNVRDLHPGVWNTMNAAERDLYQALSARTALTKEEEDG